MGKQVVLHNREMCDKCRFSLVYRDAAGHVLHGKSYCNYAGVTGETALKRLQNGDVINRKGSDPDNCNLFEERKKSKSAERREQIKKALY